jgi:asparagine synthase (glutamine-hydrolysing)
VRDLLPEAVWDRPKQGFTLPFSDWLKGPLASEVGATLQSAQRLERVRLRPTATRDVWRRFNNGTLSWSRPWALYTLVRWAETLDVAVSNHSVGIEQNVA